MTNNYAKNNKSGGYSHMTSTLSYGIPEISNLQKFVTYSVNNFDNLMVDISSGINVYNWVVNNYNNIIDKYNNFMDYCRTHQITYDIKLNKISEINKYNIINMPCEKHMIPQPEVIHLINEMNRRIQIMKTLISDIKYKIKNTHNIGRIKN